MERYSLSDGLFKVTLYGRESVDQCLSWQRSHSLLIVRNVYWPLNFYAAMKKRGLRPRIRVCWQGWRVHYFVMLWLVLFLHRLCGEKSFLDAQRELRK